MVYLLAARVKSSVVDTKLSVELLEEIENGAGSSAEDASILSAVEYSQLVMAASGDGIRFSLTLIFANNQEMSSQELLGPTSQTLISTDCRVLKFSATTLVYDNFLIVLTDEASGDSLLISRHQLPSSNSMLSILPVGSLSTLGSEGSLTMEFRDSEAEETRMSPLPNYQAIPPLSPSLLQFPMDDI
jgi:hypothetical protein